MATVVESWMKENYPKYSLKILEDFEVYRKFQ